MYSQYPPYPYYSAGMSGGYTPVATPTYMPQQQGYYAQQYPPQPVVVPAPPAPPANGPSMRRLPIKDPTTGLVIPVVTAVQVEQAVSDYHRNSQVCPLAAYPSCMWIGTQLSTLRLTLSLPCVYYTHQDWT